MKRTRTYLAFSLAGSLLVGACSGDDDVISDASDASSDAVADVARDSGLDTGPDSGPRVDATGGSGGSLEASTDARETGAAGSGAAGMGGSAGGPLVDASDGEAATVLDGSTAGDASEAGDASDARETSVVSDAADSSPEAEAAAPADASDAAAPTPITIDQFQHAIDVAWCTKFKSCCTTLEPTFAVATCSASLDTNYGAFGLANYLQQYNGRFASAHLLFDPAAAQRCVDLINVAACVSYASTDFQTMYATCITAAQGTLSAGKTGCSTSLECTVGNYCAPASDGGLGTCLALKGEGAACADPNFTGDQCNYLGTVSPGTPLYCAPVGGGTGACTKASPSTPKKACSFAQECSSGLCNFGNRSCDESTPIGAPNICALGK